jgi:hypothetical protein
MKNNLISEMVHKSDSELLEYVTNRAQFQYNVVIAAIVELEERGKADSEILDVKKQIAREVEQYMQQFRQSKKELEIKASTDRKQSRQKKAESEIKIGVAKSITNAAKLIYLVVAIGIINSILLEQTPNYQSFSSATNIITLIFTLGIILFIAYKINSGKRWARNLFILFFGIGLFILPYSIKLNFGINPIIGGLTVIQTGLQVFALILLLKKESRDWYARVG